MTSTRAATVWRSVHFSLLLAVLVAGTSGATPRHRLRSSSPTKIDFWSAYEDAINRFGHIGSSSSGSGLGTPGVEGQEGSKLHVPAQETSSDSTKGLHQSQYHYLGLNHKGHLIQHHPEDDEFKSRLVELKVKHVQDLLGHSQTSRTQQISVPNNPVEDSTMVDNGWREQRPLDVIESPEANPVMSKGSVPSSSNGAKDAMKNAAKKVVKRRRKPVSVAGESLARYPTPRLTVTDEDVTTNTNHSVSVQPGLAISPTPTPVGDRQRRTSTRTEGTIGEGFPDDGTANQGTTKEGTTIAGTTDDPDEGTTNEDATTDEGTTDSTSDSSDRAVYPVSSDDFTTDRTTNGDTDNSTDNKISNSRTSNNNPYDGDDGNTTTASNKSNSIDLKKSGQTTASKDNINHKGRPANSSSPSAQQLSGPSQLWPNSQDAGDGSGAILEPGVIDSIIANVIKIQENFNETSPNDTTTKAPDVEDGISMFKSPLLIHHNGTSVFQDASSSNGSKTIPKIQQLQRKNNTAPLVRAKPTALGTKNTTDNTNLTRTAVPGVAAPPDPSFTPPVRTNLLVLAQAASPVVSAPSSSPSAQSPEELSQFDYVVRAVQNPSLMTAAVLDVANTVGLVGAIMSIPFLFGKRRRRRDAEGVFGISREVDDRDLILASMRANARL